MSGAPDAGSLVVEGELRVAHERPAPWRVALAPLFELALTFARVLPTAPDSVAGRSRSNTIKVVFVAAGVVVLLGAREVHFALAPLGLVIMSGAVWLPVTDLRKRGLIRTIKGIGRVSEVDAEPVRLEHDGRRLILWRGEARARRVLTNRTFRLDQSGHAGRAAVVVRPKDKGGKKTSICLLGPAGSGSGADAIDPDRLFEPVWVDDEAKWEELVAVLARAQDVAAGTP